MTLLPALPPRCLSVFRIHRVDSANAGLPMPDGFISYALECHCGDGTWRVYGNWLEDTSEFVGPLFANCSHCGAGLRIINTAIDGFNGEIGEGIVENETPNVMWFCDQCGAPDGSLIASFGYHFEPDAEITARLQDYFDTFILTHICVKSKKTVQVTMFDCA